jgi:hypothetical protein
VIVLVNPIIMKLVLKLVSVLFVTTNVEIVLISQLNVQLAVTLLEKMRQVVYVRIHIIILVLTRIASLVFTLV